MGTCSPTPYITPLSPRVWPRVVNVRGDEGDMERWRLEWEGEGDGDGENRGETSSDSSYMGGGMAR